jgi:pimeloyl-ACP methyl ester carboxylesterase
MKILCLHGAGSSGAILERQMSSLRRELDPSFELVFVDGPFECGRGPGT